MNDIRKMKNSLPLGRYAGIPVAIHWSFILILVFFAYRGFASGLAYGEVLYFLLFILVLFFCVLLHEFGHALMARRYGIRTRSIVLLPIGGVATLEKMPDNPKEELAVALAGPAVNILIAIALFPFADLGLLFPAEGEMPVLFKAEWNFALSYLYFVNLMLVVFNLLPAFPMDGGRVLRALLSFRFAPHKATRIAATIGQMMALLFVFLGLFAATVNPMLVIIGLFIFLGAKSEADFKQNEFLVSGICVRDVLLTQFGVLEVKMKIKDALTILLSSQSTEFLVMDDKQCVGALSRSQLLSVLQTQGPEASILKAVVPASVLRPEQSLKEVMDLARSEEARIWPVSDNGELIGALDYENVMEYIQIRKAWQAK